MNSFLRNTLLQSPTSNIEAVIIEVCHMLQLNVTSSTISQYLKRHPETPSLSSVSDTLGQFNIESLGFHLENKMNLKNTKGPVIVQIREIMAMEDYLPLFYIGEKIISDGGIP